MSKQVYEEPQVRETRSSRQPSTQPLTRRASRRAGLFEPTLVRAALRQSFIMLRPDIQWKNPVMFVVEIGTVLSIFYTIQAGLGVAYPERFTYFLALDIWLFLTVIFANFATALAEVRGKAQADSLRKTRRETLAFRLRDNGQTEQTLSTNLKLGEKVVVEAGQIVPADGEIIEGVASIDESAITGESAPVIRESGGDRSGVTGGTLVLSDRIVVQVTGASGTSFLDRMIALVEGAIRQRTPNEIALAIVLAAFTLIFLLVTAALYPMAWNAELYMTGYVGAKDTLSSLGTDVPTLVALLVCLIPTTIGALLAAIGIAGMDRALRANIIAKSGKAVEVAGDVDTLLLDKTGTITIGNRRATQLIPMEHYSVVELGKLAAMASFADQTPEGKSIVDLVQKQQPAGPDGLDRAVTNDSQFVPFTAQTRMSGVDLADGRHIRKGAPDAVVKHVQQQGGQIPPGMQERVDQAAAQGSTPLLVHGTKNSHGHRRQSSHRKGHRRAGWRRRLHRPSDSRSQARVHSC